MRLTLLVTISVVAANLVFGLAAAWSHHPLPVPGAAAALVADRTAAVDLPGRRRSRLHPAARRRRHLRPVSVRARHQGHLRAAGDHPRDAVRHPPLRRARADPPDGGRRVPGGRGRPDPRRARVADLPPRHAAEHQLGPALRRRPRERAGARASSAPCRWSPGTCAARPRPCRCRSRSSTTSTTSRRPSPSPRCCRCSRCSRWASRNGCSGGRPAAGRERVRGRDGGMSIEVRGVTKSFGAAAVLHGVDLEVQLRGAGGAARAPPAAARPPCCASSPASTPPTPGSVRVSGEDTSALAASERRVGFVFQHYALFRRMTVFDNVAFGLQVRPRRERPSREAIRERVMELLRTRAARALRRPDAGTALGRPAAARGARAGARRRAARSCCSTSRSGRSTPACAASCASGCAGCTTSCT